MTKSQGYFILAILSLILTEIMPRTGIIEIVAIIAWCFIAILFGIKGINHD